MTFPVIVSTTGAATGGTATTTPSITLPSGTGAPASGQLLVVIFRTADGSSGITGWPSGWSVLDSSTADGSDDATALAYHLCTGSEPSAITVTTASAKYASLAMLIEGAISPTIQPPEISTVATGSSTTPAPTICTPTGGAKDYLWIWLGGWEGEQTSPPAGSPTSYGVPSGDDSGTGAAVTTNCRVAKARRVLNAASETAGSWTISVTDEWTAWLMAVHPQYADPRYLQKGPTPIRQAVTRASVI